MNANDLRHMDDLENGNDPQEQPTANASGKPTPRLTGDRRMDKGLLILGMYIAFGLGILFGQAMMKAKFISDCNEYGKVAIDVGPDKRFLCVIK